MSLFSKLKNRPRSFNLLHQLHLVEAHSQTSANERSCLAEYARGQEVAVEIGTFMGVTAVEIAKALAPNGTLYCVDPYDGCEAFLQVARRHIERNRVQDKIQLIRHYSQDALSHLPKKIDFCFVDGDHSFEGLERDWKIVQGILKVDGIVGFHDTTMPSGQYCGAAEFFEKFIRNADGYKHLRTVESLNVMQRIGQ